MISTPDHLPGTCISFSLPRYSFVSLRAPKKDPVWLPWEQWEIKSFRVRRKIESVSLLELGSLRILEQLPERVMKSELAKKKKKNDHEFSDIHLPPTNASDSFQALSYLPDGWPGIPSSPWQNFKLGQSSSPEQCPAMEYFLPTLSKHALPV